METRKILSSSLLDILFDGKNKNYGAYELRKNYNQRISSSLIITFSVIGTLLCVFSFGREIDPSKPIIVSTEITLTEIQKEEVKPTPPPPPPKEIETTAPKTIKFTTPIIVENPDEPPPAQVDIRGAQISIQTRDGDTCQVAPIPEGPFGDGITDKPSEPEIFEKVEIEASFPGGMEKWARYLERSLFGTNPSDEGAPEGTFTTIVQFVVDVDGSISNVVSLTNHGYGMEEAAIRTIKKGPKWNPAIQNGRQVKAYRKQMITFVVGN